MRGFDLDLAAYPVTTAIFALLGFLVYRLLQVGKREHGLPPGPPTFPILGNAAQIPPRYAHLKFQEWSRTYGPIISCKIFGATMIVLNDAHSVREVLDKRSASSSDRPPSHICAQLIARNNHILLANGPRSALFRRLWNISISPINVGRHAPLQNAEGIAVLHNVLHRPSAFYEEMRRYSASLTLSIAFGKRAPTFAGKDASGFCVKDFYRFNEQVSHEFNYFLEVGAAPPLDIIPILKYVPEYFAGWKQRARKNREDMKRIYLGQLFKEVKLKMEKGMLTGCWMEEIIQRNDGLDDESLAWNGGVMMEGGSDTTSGALLTAVLAAVCHPEAVAKAHEELDRVIGSERSPVLEDIESLPYCRAFVLEVMRWRPVAPAGVPHLSTKDEVINGYIIPTGSIIVANAWAVLHDPKSYEDPESFNPDRFMKNKFGIKDGIPQDDWRNTFPFGAGRRICLGSALAEASLNTNIPKLLWAFKFHKAKDPATGQEISVSVEKFEPGHLTAPVRFQCDIAPRSEAIRETIEREYGELKPLYKQYEVSIPLDS